MLLCGGYVQRLTQSGMAAGVAFVPAVPGLAPGACMWERGRAMPGDHTLETVGDYSSPRACPRRNVAPWSR